MRKYSWLMTFDDKAEVIKHEEARNRLFDIAETIKKNICEEKDMKYEWIDEFLMVKPGVTKDLQEEWNWIRYQIDGKMFAAICRDDDNKPVYITLKLEPAEGEFWRGQFVDVIPGYYMNKVHWNSVKAEGEVPDDVVKGMLENAYRIVFNSIPKKKQKEILDNAEK